MAATETATAARNDPDRLALLADVLDVLIRFHDREIDRALLDGLRQYDVIEGLGSALVSRDSRSAVRDLAAALDVLGSAPSESALDDLAADFADLYLTHGFRVSPSGSVWLTEDRLERQLPMFEVRDWYEHYGVTVPDWRVRADDHLVHELQFLSHLCRMDDDVAAQDAGRFMDLHVLPWLPEFCRRAGERVSQPVYAAVMQMTLACLEELRATLEDRTGRLREVRETGPLETSRQPEPEPTPYMPGVSESW